MEASRKAGMLFCYDLYGDLFSVSFLSNIDRLFRGVLLQGRTVTDDSPAGTFESSDPFLRLSSCNPPEVGLTCTFLSCGISQ